jgi:hypothetical protein
MNVTQNRQFRRTGQRLQIVSFRKSYEHDDAGTERSPTVKTPVNAATNNPGVSTHVGSS